ncbi:MAG: heavy metal translocating P-type ATPase [Neisseria sp.]|nr:heavy metal translocating P-type ATPase [Neisseria sp.]
MTEKIRLNIEGMTCQACAARIEKVLNKKDFIQLAQVNFASESAQIEFDPQQSNAENIIQIIEKTGFSAKLPTQEAMPSAVPSVPWQIYALLILSAPFLFGMLGMLLGRHDFMLPTLWQLLFASIVQFALALPFYRGAFASVKAGAANMDVLVSVGTLSIYFYSLFLWLEHQEHAIHLWYLEASVMVIAFVSLGKFLEQRTKQNSLNSIGLLLQLTPQTVERQNGDNWQQVSLKEVNIGDVLRAKAGERIAADGIVIAGEAWLNESHLTGESLPESKTQGCKVLAGALLENGSVVYQSSKLGADTLLGDMIQALADAQDSKAPIARLADKVAAVFVPSVLLIALLTFIATYFITNSIGTAIVHSVAVLVIACPCALGLATPAAIMVGMGKAAKAGIWFKDASALERAAKIDAVVLDKTGTLTTGKPHIAAIWCATDYSENQILQAAASVERHALHPLAQAIVQTASERNIALLAGENVQNQIGLGVSMNSEWGEIKVGKAEFCGMSVPSEFSQQWQAASLVCVSIAGKAAGVLALSDTLKSDSIATIAALRKHNIEVYLLSGDRDSAVQHIAQQVNIASKNAIGNCQPRDKAAFIQQLQAQGKIVAMIGDGVNDAPALAAADVSFAMHAGSDIAQHSASATLMQHSIAPAWHAIVLAKATLRTIKQNLFFAFVYNVLGIPLAAFGLLTPLFAGIAMTLSSLSVLGNALRLKRLKIDVKQINHNF